MTNATKLNTERFVHDDCVQYRKAGREAPKWTPTTMCAALPSGRPAQHIDTTSVEMLENLRIFAEHGADWREVDQDIVVGDE